MARTGIDIKVSDTVLGGPKNVNATSMIVFTGALNYDWNDDEDGYTGVGKQLRSSLLYSVTSPDINTLLEELTGKYARPIVESDEEGSVMPWADQIQAAVDSYFRPTSDVDLTGNTLWLLFTMWPEEAPASEVFEEALTAIPLALSATATENFANRPRQLFVHSVIGYNYDKALGFETDRVTKLNSVLAAEHLNGFRTVAIIDGATGNLLSLKDLSSLNAPYVAVCVSYEDSRITAGYRALGMLAAVTVGTSIGDGGLAPLVGVANNIRQAVSYLGLTSIFDYDEEDLQDLGLKQWLFARPRPPRNGLWWNDGATCNASENALSTLEASRTICSIADDLQAFFVPYINTRVPVNAQGDIQSTYKQVVLDSAFASVVQPYIDNGDISDARINLVAKGNDMVGTRTWEVSLSILPAPTLRWIEGYVFYIKNLA